VSEKADIHLRARCGVPGVQPPYRSVMSTDHAYEVYALELGPYDSLAELHGELSNQAATFAKKSA